MKRSIIVVQLIGCLLLGISNVFAQGNTGKVTGKLTDKKTGEVLIGVTVLVQNTAKGAVTDVEGRFLLQLDPGTYTLDFKYMGYQTKSISEVQVKPGQVTNLDVALDEPKSKELQEVVIRGSYKQESINALYAAQKNNPSISSGISAESIKRSPDRSTGEVLKRVSGASIQDNKYIIVRGLNDRYNTATINNAVLPSTEPDRKAFSFDIIPSNLIDNITINKTASPDMPADFSGGFIQVVTKDIPAESFLSFSAGLGYNSQSTFKDIQGMKRGGMDWLGFDDGTRKMPSSFPSSRSKYVARPNAEKIAISKDFKNNYGVSSFGNALPNMNYQLTWGSRSRLKNGGSFGSIISLTYRNAENINPSTRTDFDNEKVRSYNFSDKIYKYNTSLGAIANFTYIKGNNKVSFKNIVNRIFDNVYIYREGTNVDANQAIIGHGQDLTEKSLVNSQLEGSHKLNKKDWKLDWNLNYSLSDRNQPDLKVLTYSKPLSEVDDPSVPYKAQVPVGTANRNVFRFYSVLQDNSFGGSAQFSIPFTIANNKQLLKFGGQKLYKTRMFSARALGYIKENFSATDESLLSLPPDRIFAPENMRENGFMVDEITNSTDKYDATSDLMAGFIMFDNKIADKLRIVWGARGESYYQYIKTSDPSGKRIRQTTTWFDILPSANITYSLNAKSNLRLSGSQTVSRPELRELAGFAFYDFVTYSSLLGNPYLKRAKITNLDLRYEIYPGVGEAITASLFYKRFKDPIEQKVDPGSTPNRRETTFQNAPSAESYGFEIELRKKLDFISQDPIFSNTTFFTNFSLIQSAVNLTGVTTDVTNRALQGQSPYLVNAGLQWLTPDSDWGLSVLYNRVGHRISLLGFPGYADIYENGRDILDFQISKKVIKSKGELRLNVSDLLNQAAIFYQNGDDRKRYTEGVDQVINSVKFGTNVSLTFSYQFNTGKKK
ncbi:TonB-dependent receptor [Chitinophaga alhagiae]|uniref:TonB-dependent receptor n=1 Tax=Chitinophaga alhagiae TaxID=2203219 RepID=A0ABN5LR69_9BACT|nr:TonB-dependent receptor [Chitinophaga alhagiae]